MPKPDDYDYSKIREWASHKKESAVYVGGPGLGDCLNSAGMIRTYDQVLVDVITDEPAGLLYMQRRCAIQLETTRRTLEAGQGAIDFLWMGEDLGTQNTPLISMDTYRKHIKPRHQEFIDLAKSFNLPVMIHTCGSSSWVYEELIGMGVNVVDTLQPEAANMSPEYLMKTFGNRLAYHGCISTAGALANGTPDDVEADCRHTLEVMMPGRGYCFAPTHAIQDNSPTENVVRMYECVQRLGRYR